MIIIQYLFNTLLYFQYLFGCGNSVIASPIFLQISLITPEKIASDFGFKNVNQVRGENDKVGTIISMNVILKHSNILRIWYI